ncbi:TonB-dependent hemoglobin/transferrin/lactoferrin family receptor [Bordetella holmesii]|uniref:TonB-dependent heme/hemoglobin receptor family protein n=2 Tax=Bordetella holmesii TaxID=35814 RepID=A0A158MAU4_9BORD|nr:TonB-dependent hemoglobin/transferrin/lactoferrin family receptor [Bordetella holmesii]AHV92927.1 tonB-dependent hemoglobin/transferrin/lactoferrin receptor family protein [Bordetella holmesii ATCC 51541]EWM41807.1 tonB-dependent hemoglobin/transferrin/lactoferrin receptor family protein [Bordetella holmesii 41130]EWM46729.1 tonB-dependent hemoglobin/transferrin/lactoferrin receptor family protein [Bordetella holmesii 35009]EWM50896.1 tonB-dependent hemoglobin/transferrin/lactoferrin recepto
MFEPKPLALAALFLPSLAISSPNDDASDSRLIFTLPAQQVVADSVELSRSELNQTDIDRAQADNFASLVDRLPGIAMAGSARPGGQSLNIWGLGDTEDVKLVLDGAPKGFEKYRQGSVFIEPELIRRITVDKGPHNLLDGTAGFGGTVRIDTKDAGELLAPEQRFGGLVKYGRHSNDGQDIYSGALFGRTDHADGLIYVNRRDGGNLRRPDGSRFPFSGNNAQSYLAKTNLYLGTSHSLSVSAMQSTAHGWQPFAAKRDDLPAPSLADIRRWGLTGAWRRRLVYRDQSDRTLSARYTYAPADQPWLNLTLSYAHSRTAQHDRRPDNASRSAFLGTLGNRSWVDYRDRVLELRNLASIAAGSVEHGLLLAARWHQHDRDTLMYYPAGSRDRDYNYGYFQPYYMPAGRQTVRSLVVQDAIRVAAVTITPGVRYDHVVNLGHPNDAPRYNSPLPSVGHDYRRVTYTGWTPHLGALWKAQPWLDLLADVTRGWRAPVIDEQYEVQYARASVTGTSRSLRPERILGWRAGAIVTLKDVLAPRDNLVLRATVFGNRGKDEIFVRRGVLCANSPCERPLSNYRNLPGYHIEGLELESAYDSARWFGKLSLSAIRGRRDTSPRDPAGQRSWIAEIPPLAAHAMLGLKLARYGMAVGWTADFVRRQDRSPTQSDPLAVFWALPASSGYALHGLFAHWQPPQWKGLHVRVTVDNLFNRDYRPYLGESVAGLGRNVKLSLSQRF